MIAAHRGEHEVGHHSEVLLSHAACTHKTKTERLSVCSCADAGARCGQAKRGASSRGGTSRPRDAHTPRWGSRLPRLPVVAIPQDTKGLGPPPSVQARQRPGGTAASPEPHLSRPPGTPRTAPAPAQAQSLPRPPPPHHPPAWPHRAPLVPPARQRRRRRRRRRCPRLPKLPPLWLGCWVRVAAASSCPLQGGGDGGEREQRAVAGQREPCHAGVSKTSNAHAVAAAAKAPPHQTTSEPAGCHTCLRPWVLGTLT